MTLRTRCGDMVLHWRSRAVTSVIVGGNWGSFLKERFRGKIGAINISNKCLNFGPHHGHLHTLETSLRPICDINIVRLDQTRPWSRFFITSATLPNEPGPASSIFVRRRRLSRIPRLVFDVMLIWKMGATLPN